MLVYYFRGLVNRDFSACVRGTDGMSQGVLVSYLDIKSVHTFCFSLPLSTFYLFPLPTLRSNNAKLKTK